MNWIVTAFEQLPPDVKRWITVAEDGKSFTVQMQNAPVSETGGVVGCQVGELIKLPLALIQFLNTKFPCRENSLTVTKLQEAEHWDQARTRDRVTRGVEGYNKA